MATSTITGLTAVAAANLNDSAVIPVDDSAGNTRKATVAQLRAAIGVWPIVAEYELAVASASVVFSSLPGTYRSWMLNIRARSAAAVTNERLHVRLNGDAGANYDWVHQAGGATAGAGSTSGILHEIPGATAGANLFSVHRIVIPEYSDGTKEKGLFFESALKWNTTSGFATAQGGVFWRSVAPITSITFTAATGNLAVGSVFTLYGIV